MIRINLPYKPSSGDFGSSIRDIQWYHCRDMFLSTHLTKMLFCCGEVSKKVVIQFIKDIENILNLNKKTKFDNTQVNNILYIVPSSFWREQSKHPLSRKIRKSFFSMALRAGMKYDCSGTLDSIIATFGKSKYGRNAYAIERFLKGHCNYTGKNSPFLFGWCRAFEGKNEESVNRLLVK